MFPAFITTLSDGNTETYGQIRTVFEVVLPNRWKTKIEPAGEGFTCLVTSSTANLRLLCSFSLPFALLQCFSSRPAVLTVPRSCISQCLFIYTRIRQKTVSEPSSCII